MTIPKALDTADRPHLARPWQGVPDPASEGCFTIAVLLLAAGPYLGQIWALPEGDDILLGSWTLVALTMVALLWRHCGPRWLLWSLTNLPLIWLVLTWALASSLWSLEPERSARAALWLLDTTMVGLFIGYRFGLWNIVRILFWSFALILGLSVVMALAAPEVGMHPDGAWRGIMPHKNELGGITAMAALLFLVGTLRDRITPAVGITMVILAIGLVALSRSATAIVIVLVCAPLVILLVISKRFGLTKVAGLTLFALIGPVILFLVLSRLDASVALLDRDVTLTQRTLIWSDSLVAIGDAPWSGHGLEAVWGLGEETWFPELETTRWATHAHNGFLQLAADLGIPAAILGTAVVLGAVIAAFKHYVRSASAFALLSFALLLAFIIMNLSEARLFQYRRLSWIIAVALITALTRSFARPKAGSGSPPAAARVPGLDPV